LVLDDPAEVAFLLELSDVLLSELAGFVFDSDFSEGELSFFPPSEESLFAALETPADLEA